MLSETNFLYFYITIFKRLLFDISTCTDLTSWKVRVSGIYRKIWLMCDKWIVTLPVLEYRYCFYLTHWGRVTYISFSKLAIIDSDNGLSPGQRQAIIWTSAGILLIGLLGRNFSEILIAIRTFSFAKMYLKMSSGKWRPFCLSFNVLKLFFTWTLLGIVMGVFSYHANCSSPGMPK